VDGEHSIYACSGDEALRSSCFGGQGMLPYEQNTQQSPSRGRSSEPQPEQS